MPSLVAESTLPKYLDFVPTILITAFPQTWLPCVSHVDPEKDVKSIWAI